MFFSEINTLEIFLEKKEKAIFVSNFSILLIDYMKTKKKQS